MKTEPRGTPPYKIFSNKLKDVKAHPVFKEDFEAALEVLFDFTDGGRDTYEDPYVLTPPRIVDSSGETVFSVTNPDDLKLLHQMDEKTRRAERERSLRR